MCLFEQFPVNEIQWVAIQLNERDQKTRISTALDKVGNRLVTARAEWLPLAGESFEMLEVLVIL